MRQFGMAALLIGIIGFFYCSAQLDKVEPLPPGLSVGAALHYPAGRWQMGQYGSAGLAGFGVLMAMFPKGR